MVQIWDEGGGSGETTNTKNELDEKELINNGAAVAAWWIDTTGNPVEAWNALSREGKINAAGEYRALYGRGGGWEDVDVGEDETGGDGHYEPPTGAEEIQLVFKKEIGGHMVRIWTYGLLIRIDIGDETRIVRLPDVNQLVLLIEAIKRKFGVG